MKLKIALVFFLICVMCYVAAAQPYPSNNGTFVVDQRVGCAPFTVNVTVPSAICDPPTSNCDFFYEPQSSIQNIFTYTYNTPGTYNLIGVFQGGITDRITITVLPNVPPAFEIYSCGGNAVQVRVTDTNYDQYVINYNDGSPDVIMPAGNLAIDTHTFMTQGNKNITVRGRKLGAADNCNPASKSVNAVPVLPIPTIT